MVLVGPPREARLHPRRHPCRHLQRRLPRVGVVGRVRQDPALVARQQRIGHHRPVHICRRHDHLAHQTRGFVDAHMRLVAPDRPRLARPPGRARFGVARRVRGADLAVPGAAHSGSPPASRPASCPASPSPPPPQRPRGTGIATCGPAPPPSAPVHRSAGTTDGRPARLPSRGPTGRRAIAAAPPGTVPAPARCPILPPGRQQDRPEPAPVHQPRDPVQNPAPRPAQKRIRRAQLIPRAPPPWLMGDSQGS